MATLLAGGVLLCGCGGVSASPSFSPMMLLVPGLGKSELPAPPATLPEAVEPQTPQPARAG